jgi:hypothetical protein
MPRPYRKYGDGLSYDTSSGRWKIICRDGTQLWYYRGVAAAQIGRLLRPDEIVHHIDGDCSNDDPENLEVTTRAAHMREHRGDIAAGRGTLSAEQVADIHYLVSAGWHTSGIASAYGISNQRVRRIGRASVR